MVPVFAALVSPLIDAYSTWCDSVPSLGSKVPSPTYEAVSVRSPGDVKVMAQLPWATLALHDSPPSDETVTVPVGVPASDVTRNSTATVWPPVEGSASSAVISVEDFASRRSIGSDVAGAKPSAVNWIV